MSAHIERMKAFRERKNEDEAYASARLDGMVPKSASQPSKTASNVVAFQTPAPIDHQTQQLTQQATTQGQHPRSHRHSISVTPNSGTMESTLMRPTGRIKRRNSASIATRERGFSFSMGNERPSSAAGPAREKQAQWARPATAHTQNQNTESLGNADPMTCTAASGELQQQPPKGDDRTHPQRGQKLEVITEEMRRPSTDGGGGGASADIGHVTKLVDRVIALEAELREAHEKVRHVSEYRHENVLCG